MGNECNVCEKNEDKGKTKLATGQTETPNKTAAPNA